MKINISSDHFLIKKSDCKDLFKIMKICLLFLFAFTFQLLAIDSNAQDAVIALKNNSTTVSELINEIEKQTDYLVVYSNREVDTNRKINFKNSSNKVSVYLNEAFSDTDIGYDFENNYIVLSKKTSQNATALAQLIQTAQQGRTITGRVTDENGEPVIGATVVEKENPSHGTITDVEGNFILLNTPENGTLVFTYVGMITQEITLSGRTTINIIMLSDRELLDELVVVGYGVQKKSQITASISTLASREITQNPVANINNSISGRIPGVLSHQSSGEPGADAAEIRVRGIATTGANSGALIIVDGVPRAFSQLNPNEIESISVLKDAAAIAPYGLAGANGVILVTTKRGKEGTINLNYNGWYGVQQPTRYPKYLDAYGYATTLNIARKNAGLAPQYTDDQLQKYKDRSDLDHYPDHDWIKEVINFKAPITSHNISLTGGSEKVRFFGSLGYLYQEGSVDVINFSRYNISANIDVNATKSTLVSIDFKGRLEKTNNPGSINGAGIYSEVTKHPPLLATPLQFQNGLPGHTLLPAIYNSGYNKDDNNVFYSQLTIEQKINAIKGLTLKGVFAYDKNYSLSKHWQTPYIYYRLNSEDEFEETPGGVTLPRLSQEFNQRINSTLQGYITYNNKFGSHGINLLAVAEQRQGDGMLFNAERINYQVNLDELDMGSAAKSDLNNGGSSNKSKQLGIVFRASYDYSQKYLAEFSGRYDGHYYFAPGKRYAFFPAVSLGWRLSEESFIKNNFRWIDDLKIRGSYGKSGNLAGGPFQYLSSYGIGASYIFGGSQVQGAYERTEPNTNITWETAKKIDVGFEILILKGLLGLEFDVFREVRSDMLVTPNVIVPFEYGIGLSQVNEGVMNNKGFDISLSSTKNFSNGFNINGRVTVSYAKNKLVETFENASTYNNPNRRRTGRPLGTQFGLKALGLFQSQEEIDNWATQFGTLQPGDIKYADMNDDGKIDTEDEVVIGKPAFPQLIYGLTINSSWKGVDLSMHWQGAGMNDFQLTSEMISPFFNGAKIFDKQLDYWTPENRNAEYPILMPTAPPNNTQVSSWWMRDGGYLRLKNLELGFTVPSRTFMNRIGIKSLRVFVSGQNLFTFSTVSYLDPEIGVNSSSKRARHYFQQKIYSGGLNINF